MTSAAFGSERPPVVAARLDRHGLRRTPTTRPQVYFPYFDMDMVFDDSRARALLGPAGIKCPHLTDYFPRLIEYAQQTRWGKSPQTREEAAGAHITASTGAWSSTTSNSITADPCATAPCRSRRAPARGRA